ncbi:uncharacterized protein LOC133546262 isoform X3 [Nerophis ophidion]|uniref:uncharacterized protein LOC133546262 isoform X3 n=1 Tax=Nerophis ophidion TaxID=159077 RepID=UPI002ADF377F|nr:uncharacterized protein LOC133546262 isoform X3 [Nerophis ophidion]
MLKELVKERLMAAADEIFALFESTITSYEEELSRTREEKEQHRQQLEAARKTQIVLHVEDVRQLIGRQEECPFIPQDESSNFKQDDPQPHHLKYCISQSGEECLLGPQEADLTNLPLTGFSVKTEDHEDKPQVNNLFAPLSDSDDIMSHSAEDENVDYTQEPLSSDTDCEDGMRTHTDNQHPECSEKNTADWPRLLSGLVVRVSALRSVDREFKTWPSHIKYYKNGTHYLPAWHATSRVGIEG